MPNCSKCNNFIKEGQKFCTKCGAKLLEKFPPELSASLDIYEKKIAQEPLNPKLYIKLGDAYRDNKFYEGALIQYQKAVSIDETNVEALLKSGDVYFTLGKFDKAKGSSEKALKLQADLFEAKVGLSPVLKAMNSISEAIELGEEIIKTTPENLSVHKDMKDLYLQSGKEKEAIEELKMIITQNPLDKELFRQLAQIYHKRKEIENALANYRKALEHDAKDKDALFFVGRCLYEKGDYDEAIKQLEEVLTIESNNLLARSYLALSYLKKENLGKADDTFKVIFTSELLTPLSVQSWPDLVKGKPSSPKLNELKDDEKIFFADTALALGNKFLQVGNLKKSKLYFQTSLKIFRTKNAEKGLANVFAKGGDAALVNDRFDEALKSFGKALEFDKDNLEYQEKLSKAKGIVNPKLKTVVNLLFGGLIILALGVIFILLANHIIPYDRWIDYFLPTLGGIFLFDAVFRHFFLRGNLFGGKFIAGIIILLFGFSALFRLRNWWPLILIIIIIVGFLLILRGLLRNKLAREQKKESLRRNCQMSDSTS